jgi:hypothetical protein
MRPEGLEPPISVPKTGVISISLRARKPIIMQAVRFSNVSYFAKMIMISA